MDEASIRNTIARFADNLARHLITSMWPEPPKIDPQDVELPNSARKRLGIMGDYSIVGDQYRPLFAPPMNQALTAFALLTFVVVAGLFSRGFQWVVASVPDKFWANLI